DTRAIRLDANLNVVINDPLYRDQDLHALFHSIRALESTPGRVAFKTTNPITGSTRRVIALQAASDREGIDFPGGIADRMPVAGLAGSVSITSLRNVSKRMKSRCMSGSAALSPPPLLPNQGALSEILQPRLLLGSLGCIFLS